MHDEASYVDQSGDEPFYGIGSIRGEEYHVNFSAGQWFRVERGQRFESSQIWDKA